MFEWYYVFLKQKDKISSLFSLSFQMSTYQFTAATIKEMKNNKFPFFSGVDFIAQ